MENELTGGGGVNVVDDGVRQPAATPKSSPKAGAMSFDARRGLFGGLKVLASFSAGFPLLSEFTHTFTIQ